MGEDNGDGRSEEVKQLLASYDETFKHRYTVEDEVFRKYLDTPLHDPPIVENWYQRPKRNFDYSRGGDRGRGRGGWDNRRRDDRNRGYNQDRYGGNRRDGYQRDYDNRQRNDRVHYPGRRDNRRDDRHHPYQQRDQGQRWHGGDRGQDRGQDRDSNRDRDRGYNSRGDRGGRQWQGY